MGALNPCGFPLLPAYLSLFVGAREAPLPLRLARALTAGGLVTVGFVGLFGLIGIIVESGIEMLFGWLAYVMIPLGAAMVALGFLALTGRPSVLRLPHIGAVGHGRSAVAMIGFGLSYGVASLSCALPLFLAGVAGSFTRRGYATGVGDFVAYGLGMGLFLVAGAVVTATLGAGALRRVRVPSRYAPRIAGVLAVLIGSYLVYYWASDLADPLTTPGLVHAVENVQSWLSSSVAASARWVGIAFGAVVLVAMAFSAIADRRTDDVSGSASRPADPTLEQGAEVGQRVETSR